MLRQPLSKALSLPSLTSRVAPLAARKYAQAPEKVEVFVDDKPIHVEPGSTILQVNVTIITFLVSNSL